MQTTPFTRPTRADIHAIAAERNVPVAIVESVVRYVFDRIQPGQFLTAVLTNNLSGAVMFGDRYSVAGLDRLVRLLTNEEWVPWSCWGNPGRVTTWLEGGE